MGGIFTMTAEPLTKGATIRLIQTTEINSVTSSGDKDMIFRTKNSYYLLEFKLKD